MNTEPTPDTEDEEEICSDCDHPLSECECDRCDDCGELIEECSCDDSSPPDQED